MPDGNLLFTELVDRHPAAGDACRSPIGRRTVRRPRPSRSRPAARPSPTLALLGELRALVIAIGEDERTRSRHVARLVASQARPLADIFEALDQLRRRLVGVERQVGVCEPPLAPRPTRRRPDA